MLEKIITQSVYNNMLGKFYIIFEPLTLFIWCMSNVLTLLRRLREISFTRDRCNYPQFPAFLNLYRGCDQVI